MFSVSIDGQVFCLRVDLKAHFFQRIIENIPIIEHGSCVIAGFEMIEGIGNGDSIFFAELLYNYSKFDSVLKLIGKVLLN